MACINNHRCGSCPHPCKSEVKDIEHNKWFSSISVSDKEKITGAAYPQCTVLWNTWTQDERAAAIERSGLYRRHGSNYTALGHDF